MGALAAAEWGIWGGASLLVGAFIGLYARVSGRAIGFVMTLGAGVLISSVAFEPMEEAYRMGGFDTSVGGVAARRARVLRRGLGGEPTRREAPQAFQGTAGRRDGVRYRP